MDDLYNEMELNQKFYYNATSCQLLEIEACPVKVPKGPQLSGEWSISGFFEQFKANFNPQGLSS